MVSLTSQIRKKVTCLVEKLRKNKHSNLGLTFLYSLYPFFHTHLYIISYKICYHYYYFIGIWQTNIHLNNMIKWSIKWNKLDIIYKNNNNKQWTFGPPVDIFDELLNGIDIK